MSVEAAIKEKIASKKVVVYSKSSCPFCKKAKQVFQKYLNNRLLSREDYEVIEIENDPNCVAIQTYMMKKTGARTVPRVFVKGKFIGGGDQVVGKDSSGELKRLLQDKE
ncbi:uncharacterized protein LOC133203024 [Saccostrea echinata]|uniref:uncharacterized protein LOC133203024 n=1 Tax=Saccostrea echinata TaxID=191078 RepID=UPI002A7EE492|nr:uncharacterized protein LOC133203024 [Saccostrea echinata]